jgi:regulator of protease activity HflC (stomatin/prohibitin superfamily)
VTKRRRTKSAVLVGMGLAMAVLLSSCGYSVPSDMVAVQVGSGPFEAKKVKGCKPPSDRGWWTNDSYNYFPTSEREWDATGQQGADAKPFESVTDDKVVMQIPVTIRFSLKTDCEELKDFYVKYARRYGVKFENDGSYNAAWITLLRKLVADPGDQTLDRIVQDYKWQDVWNDPSTKAEIEQKMTAALRSDTSLLVQTAHKSYFDGLSVLIGKPIPPDQLASAVAETQTRVAQAQAEEAQAQADVTKAQAQTKVAEAEAQKQQAIIKGYGGIENYLKHECIQTGCNPYQPSYGAALTPSK